MAKFIIIEPGKALNIEKMTFLKEEITKEETRLYFGKGDYAVVKKSLKETVEWLNNLS